MSALRKTAEDDCYTRAANEDYINGGPRTRTKYTYEGRTLITKDPYLHAKTTVTDVNGWLRKTTDAIGSGYTITRAYDAAGSLTGVTDNVGNTLLSGVTYVYGIKPFLTAATDADRGAWSYTVDSLGEVTGWKDAKLQSFSMTYDPLSRPLTRTEPDQFSQWVWGSTPASHNVGQLIYECTGASPSCLTSATYSETRAFDVYGRPSTVAVTETGNPGNDANGAFQFTRGYSTTTGLLNTLTYPISTGGVALNLQYGYGYGLLSSITDTTDTTAICGSTCTLWTASAMNAFGQVSTETLGNGVVTTRVYDPVTSWLVKATAGLGTGAAVLNQSYSQDENGNINQRQDNNAGLTESFSYDADNRLTCTALASSCSTPTIAYDAGGVGPGNITSQSGVGTYSYPLPGQPRPHAVTSLAGTFNTIANPSFAYDANGNMTNRASSTQNVNWYSSNYPSSISGTDVLGSEEVQFNYGPDRQRWKVTYTGPGGTGFTYYIGGLVDLVFINGVANYRHYIYAGTEPVAVYYRTAAAGNSMSYILEDHQGSVSAIASSIGSTQVDESFSAFGQRRSPTSWSGSPSNTDLNNIAALTSQGYTFQTWLGQSMGLNHMNGRVQDAILGRFLSPDPNVPDPSNAQSYNRYSYVLNNPLTMVDPTGFLEARPPCRYECWYHGGQDPSSGYGDGSLFGGVGTPTTGPNPNGSGASNDPFSPNYFSPQSAASVVASGALNISSNVGVQDTTDDWAQSTVALSAGAAVGVAGESAGVAGSGGGLLDWLAAILGPAGSVIGGVLVPNMSMATEDQDSPGYTFYHGTATFSGGLLDAGASAANNNQFGSAPGFYMASDPDTAAHFAAVAAEQSGSTGVVLQYQISNGALNGLQAAGSTIRPVPGGPSRYTSFPGAQLFVPVTAYPVFNGYLSSGGIVLVGGH